jgi:hypothetical protein
VLDVKFTDLGIEIRVRDEIDAGLREEDIAVQEIEWSMQLDELSRLPTMTKKLNGQ